MNVKAVNHGPTNALVALGLAFYLAVVYSRGQLGNLWQAAQQDVITKGLWKWLLALAILYYLATVPELNKVFGPLLVIALVGMLIYSAEKNPAAFKQLTSGFASIFSNPVNPAPNLTGNANG